MTLGQKQERFSRMMMTLMLHLHTLGFSMRGGHWYRCEDCHTGAEKSVHKSKLAFDINLTAPSEPGERPRLLTGKEADDAHNLLHDYWDTLGGAKRIQNDLNHYSMEHDGRW